VRKLPLDRPRGVKLYPNGPFNRLDYNILKNTPKLKDQNRGQWSRQFVYKKYLEQKYHWPWVYIPADEEEFLRDQARFGQPCDFGTKYDAPMYEKWEEPSDYHTVDIWIPNPDFDEKDHDEYQKWLRIHNEVYRNGSCRRQRMHGVALSKKIDHRQKRAQGKCLLRKELQEYHDALNS
jgi:hypothetical protein